MQTLWLELDLECFQGSLLGTVTATKQGLLQTGNVAMKLGKTIAHGKIKQIKRNEKTLGTMPNG